MDRQPDLFDLQGRVRSSPGRRPSAVDSGPVVTTLSDDALVAMIPQADMSTVEALCSEVDSRSLEAAVPALGEVWRRFVRIRHRGAAAGATRGPGHAGRAEGRERSSRVEADSRLEVLAGFAAAGGHADRSGRRALLACRVRCTVARS